MDNEYLGETADIYTMVIDIPSGFHRLTAVDDEGNKKEVIVRIL